MYLHIRLIWVVGLAALLLNGCSPAAVTKSSDTNDQKQVSDTASSSQQKSPSQLDKGSEAKNHEDGNGEQAQEQTKGTDSLASDSAMPPGPYQPNELGVIPVLEFHRFGEEDGRWTITWDGLEQVLQELYDHGFRPINLAEAVERNINLPSGYIPVVLTFDDSNPEQFAWQDDDSGEIRQPAEKSAVGSLWRFHQKHPDWPLKGTFFVNRPAFGNQGGEDKIRWLVEQGFEVGNHTVTHVEVKNLDEQQALHEVGGLAAWVQQTIPGYRVTTLAYPDGAVSKNLPNHIWRGEYEGEAYETKGAVLVGANPAPSPYHKNWRPRAIPRIQVVNPQVLAREADRNFVWQAWQKRLLDDITQLYVADGDPEAITIYAGEESEIHSEVSLPVHPIDPLENNDNEGGAKQ